MMKGRPTWRTGGGLGWEGRDSEQKLFHGDYFGVVHMNLVGTVGWGTENTREGSWSGIFW